jgi:hypothetical protein
VLPSLRRFISWVHQSAKYSAQCNIVAFIYIKRMMEARTVLTVRNWRGIWLGAVMLAQKVFDDQSLRTSSFALILPGVTKSQLKALEFKIFSLLNFCTGVKPSVYARFYFELREIFKSITGEFRDATLLPERAPRRRPLTIKRGQILRQCVDDPAAARSAVSSARSSKASSPRHNKKPTVAVPAEAGASSSGVSALPLAVSPGAQKQQLLQQQQQAVGEEGHCVCGGGGNQQEAGLRLPHIRVGRSPAAAVAVVGAGAGAGRAIDDGAGTQQAQPHARPTAQRAPASAATTPGGLGRWGRQPDQRGARTLEDDDYINPSIFVLS